MRANPNIGHFALPRIFSHPRSGTGNINLLYTPYLSLVPDVLVTLFAQVMAKLRVYLFEVERKERVDEPCSLSYHALEAIRSLVHQTEKPEMARGFPT